MIKSRDILQLPLSVMMILFFLTGQIFAAGWWNMNWPYRVRVKLNPKDIARLEKNLPGDDVAVVEFRTAGLAYKDGSDIRVITPAGTQQPSRILQIGPGDLVRLAFAIRKDTTNYSIYFGQKESTDSTQKKQANSPAKTLELKRGVLLEVWPYTGGPANNLNQARQTIARAEKQPVIGRDFRDRIFLGYNPFSQRNKIVARYTAYLLAEESGEYLFSCSSNNASFLLVNDQLVVNNGRWHGPQRDTRKSGKIKLDKGLFKLTFLHVNPWGWPVVVAAYRPPGNRKVSVIPPGAYTEILKAQPGPIEHYGQAMRLDFEILPGGETFMDNRYYQRRIFRAHKTGSGVVKKGWQWDFGDGQKISGSDQVEHVYLTPGMYKITLQHTAAPKLKQTHEVQINRDWDKVTSNDLDSLKDYAEIVADYDFATLNSKANLEAALLFQRVGNFKSFHKACEAFINRKTARDFEIRTLLPAYVEALLPINQAGRAVAALKKSAGMTRNPNVQAEMLTRAGKLELDPLNKPDDAMKTFEAILRKFSQKARPDIIRDTHIGIGDVWRSRGNFDKAQAAYTQAGVTDKQAQAFQSIVKGDFARQAEDLIRRREYPAAEDAIVNWEHTFPLDRLEGYSTSLRCQLLLAREKYRQAAQAAETLVRTNPKSNYAPELLMQAADAYAHLNEMKQANRCLAEIMKNYKESPLFQKASERLKQNQAKK